MRNATIRDIMDIAARKRGVEGWYPYRWERVGDDSIVTGAVPLRYYSKGKRKGEPDLTGAISERVVVTRAEIDQAAADYERETGKCWDCKGSGQIQVGSGGGYLDLLPPLRRALLPIATYVAVTEPLGDSLAQAITATGAVHEACARCGGTGKAINKE